MVVRIIEGVKKRVNSILLFGVMLFCLILSMANIFRLSNRTTLVGVTLSSFPTDFSLKAVFDGSFQDGWERWFRDNFYGHTVVVKSRNQFAYTVFKDGSSDWMRGQNGYLYKKSEAYLYAGGNRANNKSQKEYADYAEQLYLLQTKLEEIGKDFLYIITPYKAEIYPEYLPWYDKVLQKKYVDQENSTKKSLIRAFEKYGVNYYDTTDILKDIREKEEYPAFALTGHHWTLAAAADAFDILLSDCEKRSCGNQYPHIIVDGMTDQLYGRDKDLHSDLNIFSDVQNVCYQTPIISYSQQSDLSAYLFGTSYTLEISDAVSKDISQRPFDNFFVQQYLTRLVTTDENGQITTAYSAKDKMSDRAILAHIRESDIIMIEQPGILGILDTHVKFLDYVNRNIDQLYYTPGDNILLYAEDPQSFEDFFEMQDDIRWMEGTTGTVHFHGNKIKEVSEERYLSMSLCSYYLTQKVDIFFNGEILCTIEVTPDNKDYRVKIPEYLIQENENKVAFLIHGETYSPRSLGESKDSRNLGLGFTFLAIDGG